MVEHSLRVEELSRRYGDVVALDGITFEVAPGSIHGFVGANGAGKTTTMRIVVGVERADHGRVTFGGRPLDDSARRRVGYLPEERGLYGGMRAAQQVAYLGQLHGMARDDARSRAQELLERLGLGDRLGDEVEELSQGNQQRVQLAAALVHDPDLLILDEPFAGLDPVATDAMADALADAAAGGVPVLFSSHQLELVERLCDRVTIISSGRLVADGAIAELRRERTDRRYRVDVDAPEEQWLDGHEVLSRDEHGAVVRLADDADEQQLLDAARRSGAVTRFGPVEPSLAELYREVTR